MIPAAQVFGGSKIGDFVQFPLEGLSISEFLADAPAISTESHYLYDAIGTIEHRGMLYGGHYISYTKHPSDGLWSVVSHCRLHPTTTLTHHLRYLHDDTSVSVVSADVVKRSAAYVIFYRRRPLHDAEKRRTEIVASVAAAAAAAARAKAAAGAAAGRAHTPVSALDANNVVSEFFARDISAFFSHPAGLGSQNVADVASGAAPKPCCPVPLNLFPAPIVAWPAACGAVCVQPRAGLCVMRPPL